jgi:glycosyltransferase involved in cell wall biosynthesis
MNAITTQTRTGRPVELPATGTLPRVGLTTFGTDGRRSGIGQYVAHLLPHLAELGLSETGEVLAHADEASFFSAGVPVVEFGTGFRHPALNVAWHQAVLPGWSRRRGYDVLFLPAANRRATVWAPCPTVGTVHDFSMLHVDGKYDPLRGVYIRQVLPALARRLTRVIAPSEASRRDIVGHAQVPEERVHVIPHGVDHRRYTPGDPEEAARTAARHGIEGPYVVYVSRLEHPGKNHVRLIEAWDEVKRRTGAPHRLVLAGSDWMGAEHVHAAARGARHGDSIVLTGYLPGADLADLYRAADLMVFPSLYEGFGMPLLEAMACGTPVVCSNVSSLPEVASEAGLLFDPAEPSSIARAIESVLVSPSLAGDLRDRGLARAAEFNWRRSAERTLEVLRQAALER